MCPWLKDKNAITAYIATYLKIACIYYSGRLYVHVKAPVQLILLRLSCNYVHKPEINN